MKPSDIYKNAAPSVANIVIKQNGQRVSSGTGFLVNNHLVTCAHVIDVPNNCQIDVIFEKAQSPQASSWSFSNRSALSLKGYSAEHSYDYAIVEPPAGVTLGPSLKFAKAVPDIGTEVCGLGYPFDDPHLTISAGLLSARFQSGPATMLKLDMSVNPSNSGGPFRPLGHGRSTRRNCAQSDRTDHRVRSTFEIVRRQHCTVAGPNHWRQHCHNGRRSHQGSYVEPAADENGVDGDQAIRQRRHWVCSLARSAFKRACSVSDWPNEFGPGAGTARTLA